MRRLALILILAIGSLAQARVFEMSQENFAPYLRGTYTPMSMTDGVYSDALGTGSTAQTKISYDASGELGILYGSKALKVRLGIEYLLLPRVSQNADDSSAAALYGIDSQATVLTPKLGFEINLKSWQEYRFFLLLSGGYANLASKTSYALTAAGQTQYGGLADFSESLKGSTFSGEAGIGFEGLMSDATTYAFEAGYRYMNFTQLTYTSGGTNFRGAFSSGDTALNTDGSKRTLNLSNIYVGFSFRFYLN
jgi:hypothetical protein